MAEFAQLKPKVNMAKENMSEIPERMPYYRAERGLSKEQKRLFFLRYGPEKGRGDYGLLRGKILNRLHVQHIQ
jgi:hypothetical protein